MDHRRIEEQNIAELYVTGRLSPEDEETYESHLMECSECRESVGWADDLRTSIRTVAAEDAARASVQLGFLAWASRRSRAGLLMAALLTVAALPIWLQADRSRLTRELNEARAEADRPAPAPAAPQAVAVPDTSELEKLAAENRQLAEQLRESREQLAKVDQIDEPQINTPIISLGVVRGESDATVELGPSPEPILLSLELPQVEYDTYRVTLVDNKDKTVWQKDGLEPTASETLTILFPSERLKAGTSYLFRLEGIEPGGRAVEAGDIPFRAVKG